MYEKGFRFFLYRLFSANSYSYMQGALEIPSEIKPKPHYMI